MTTSHETPALDAAGAFAQVTDGRWGRDWLWRSFAGFFGGGGWGPCGGGAIIVVGGGGGGVW
jgi:hypothetical protein